jgi:diaminopimelate decarboxylase
MTAIRSSYTDSIDFFGQEDPKELAARFGTPLYVYNEKLLRQRCQDLKGLSSHPHFHVNYSAKANTNIALLRIIREEGCVVDAMSPGELAANKAAGFDEQSITYISNNISAAEMQNALDCGLLISVDSLSQLEQCGKLNVGGRVMVRFNPGIGAGHHKKVITAGKETKFGVTPDCMEQVFAILDKYSMTMTGMNQHIGSLFMQPEGYIEAAAFLLHLAEQLPPERFAKLDHIDFGGGFGIPYHKYEGEKPLDIAALGTSLHELITTWTAKTGYTGGFYIEPGRYIAAECGLLLGRVHAVKNNGENRYVGTDIGFNVLVRPAMYDSFHDIEIYRGHDASPRQPMPQTVVGNICESGDILAKNRLLPEMHEDDLVGVLDAGAYGYTMASPYNQRLRPAEVLITAQGTAQLIRRRENINDLMRGYEGLSYPSRS